MARGSEKEKRKELLRSAASQPAKSFPDEEVLAGQLRANPPLPPWLAFPGVAPEDMHWRMGAGEDHMYFLHIFLTRGSSSEVEAYKHQYPAPSAWEHWYDS